MNIAIRLAASLLISAAAAHAQSPETPPVASPPTPVTARVSMVTSLGTITLLIETERAPITAANFLRYVDQKRLNGVGFYRAMKVGDDGQFGLVQAGLRGNPKLLYKPIAHESTAVTGLSHISGAISMARAAPGTATADFFIVLGDLTSLDAQPPNPAEPQADTAGYAVFGRVIEGMDVIRAILEQPRSATAGVGVMKGQMLETPVRIVTVRRAPG